MRPFIFCCLLAFFSSSALSTGVPSINIDAPVDPVNAKLESITDNPNNESMLKRRYEWRAEFNEIPADRLKPAPDDWDPPRWDAYQRALAAGYRACMPTCCGYNDCVADRSYCTNYCLERGQVTGMAINPKTGKMAPPARMAKRDDNPGGSIERRTSRIIDFPPENLLPRPADWDLSHWTRYQHDLVGAFVGCMPRCCGMKRCDKDPDELPWCQQHCMDMGIMTISLILTSFSLLHVTDVSQYRSQQQQRQV
ncbi:hypothetical protein BDD12DRAFT_330174 [Trichophaea hybrida]|nr:hypothetical protein BDD12DRAFT_330174 [Trichophaea hybrida]